MKTILLPFYDDDVSQHTFDLCAQIIRPVNGYLEGLFVLRLPPIVDADGDGLVHSHFAQFDEECRREAARSRTRFEACAAAQRLPLAPAADGGAPSCAWQEISGTEGQAAGSHARLFDLTVIGREFGRPWLDWHGMMESALFESGRPVLLAPGTHCATFGERVVIAWNASTETARTVALAMPLLARAKAVTVVSVDGWGSPGPAGEELADYLKRGGIPATARSVAPGGRTPGATILDECTQSGADLLLKGAYTQSRLRQLIFGGATRHILAEAQIPVLFAH